MTIWIFIVILGFISGWLSTSGSKSQFVRMIDILFLGPLMIYVSMPSQKHSIILGYLLAFFGSSTITYNLKNFLRFNKWNGKSTS